MAKLKYTKLEPYHNYTQGKILRAAELTKDAKQSLSATKLILENLKGYYANYDTSSEEEFLVNMSSEMSSETEGLYKDLSKAIEYSIKGITEAKTSENAFSKIEVGKYNQGDSYAKIFSKGTNCEYSILTDIDGIDISSKFEDKIMSRIGISNDEFELEKKYYSNANTYSSLLSLFDNKIIARVTSPEGPYVSTCLTYDKLQFETSNDGTKKVLIRGDRVVTEKYEDQDSSFRTTILGDAIYFGLLKHEILDRNDDKIFFKLGMDEISWTEEEETYYAYFPSLNFYDDLYSDSKVSIQKRSTSDVFSRYEISLSDTTNTCYMTPDTLQISKGQSGNITLNYDNIAFTKGTNKLNFGYDQLQTINTYMQSRATVRVDLTIYTTNDTSSSAPCVNVRFYMPLNTSDIEEVTNYSDWSTKLNELCIKSNASSGTWLPANGWYCEEHGLKEWPIVLLTGNTSGSPAIFAYIRSTLTGSNFRSYQDEIQCSNTMNGEISITKIN